MRGAAHRLLSTLVLALWMAPSVGALGVALHLALHHHGPHHSEHAREISELAEAATHGHRHDAEAGPEHEHEARVDGFAPALRPSSSLVAVLSSPTSAHAPLTERRCFDCSPRRGPPGPLFVAYCSLLL